MAIDDFASYLRKIRNPYQRLEMSKAGVAAPNGRQLYSLFALGNLAGAAPTTAVVPTNTTVGALGQNDSNTTQRLLSSVQGSATIGDLIVCDRLSHQGGLSGTALGAQTTNLPTAALTRYTSGAGVQLALEIYSAVGSSAQTVTASYTNQANASGRTTQPMNFGGGAGAFSDANRFFPLMLQAGDTGVRAVASVTLSGSTGAVGNFGVVLFKPLWIQTTHQEDSYDALLDLGTLPEIVNGACLFFVSRGNGFALGTLEKSFNFSEDD